MSHIERLRVLDVEHPDLPLEEIGLYLLLERFHRGMASARDFARISLIHPHLVEHGTLSLSEAGKDRLQVLRAKLAASNDELARGALVRRMRLPGG